MVGKRRSPFQMGDFQLLLVFGGVDHVPIGDLPIPYSKYSKQQDACNLIYGSAFRRYLPPFAHYYSTIWNASRCYYYALAMGSGGTKQWRGDQIRNVQPYMPTNLQTTSTTHFIIRAWYHWYMHKKVIINARSYPFSYCFLIKLFITTIPENHIPSLKLTWHLKMDGWETILSFWGPALIQGRTVKTEFRVHEFFSSIWSLWSLLGEEDRTKGLWHRGAI